MGGNFPGSGGGQQSGAGGQGGATETLRQAASAVGDVAGQVKEKVQDLASGVAGRVEDAWDTTRQGVSQGASAVVGRADDFWTGMTDLVRRYPVASVAVAFGLGCLTSACFNATFGASDDMPRRMSRYSA